MKYLVLLIIFLKISVMRADDSTGYKYFERAEKFFKLKNYDSAIFIWKDIISHPSDYNRATYGDAYYNIPIAYWKKDLNESKKWFIKILGSDLKDNDETGDLMEPHTNYKHKSARLLAEIAFRQK